MTAEEIAQSLTLKKSGRGWRGPCPVHGGTSFTLDERDGRIVWKCWNGCSQSDIVAELRSRGLWPEREKVELTPEQKRQYAIAKAQARIDSQLAMAWFSERLFELDIAKSAAINTDADCWDVGALQYAAAEHYRLSSMSASEALAAWRMATLAEPKETRRLEDGGLAWRRTCETLTRAIVQSLASGDRP